MSAKPAEVVTPAPRVGPKPCDSCRHQRRCKEASIACHAFVLFMRHEGPTRWALAPRQPTRALFDQAMNPPKVAAPRVFRRDFPADDQSESSEAT
jgi:hypothetical protein